MKPPPFDYRAPDTVEDALELLGGDGDARVLAGGQSLVQLMKFRRVRPSVRQGPSHSSGATGTRPTAATAGSKLYCSS